MGMFTKRLTQSRSDAFYKVQLGRKYEKGDGIDLEIKMVWTKVTSPFPKEIGQLESSQMYELLGNVLFYSPYPTVEQKHIVK